MSKIKIIEMKERVSFGLSGKREQVLDILYKTPKGYVGTISLPKAGFTKEALGKAVKEDMKEQEAVIGVDIEV